MHIPTLLPQKRRFLGAGFWQESWRRAIPGIGEHPPAQGSFFHTQRLEDGVGRPAEQFGIAVNINGFGIQLFFQVPGKYPGLSPGIKKTHSLTRYQVFVDRCQLSSCLGSRGGHSIFLQASAYFLGDQQLFQWDLALPQG